MKVVMKTVAYVAAVLFVVVVLRPFVDAAYGIVVGPFEDMIRGQISVFPLQRINGQLMTANRSVYRVNRDANIVIESMPDLNIPPDKRTQCAVMSRTNWRCEPEKRLIAVQYVNGEFREGYESSFVYVSRFRWWTTYVREMF